MSLKEFQMYGVHIRYDVWNCNGRTHDAANVPVRLYTRHLIINSFYWRVIVLHKLWET